MPTIAATTAETITPATQAEVVEAVRSAFDASRAIYAIGGGTALDYGVAPTQPGDTLDLTSLDRIVDYTPRDMTILVEAGMRMSDLASTLAAEGQQLPVDVPRAREATLGGVIATNWSGPRRFGHGTIRDYIIGIHAVDGRGTAFKGGGRVVKNVAGYDFCKLLTGSLGTLGVITQIALKVKPKPQRSAMVLGLLGFGNDLEVANRVLERLAVLETPPAAIELFLDGGQTTALPFVDAQASSRNWISVLLEGTEQEVHWLTARVIKELQDAGAHTVESLADEEADIIWQPLIEFPDDPTSGDQQSPMVLRIAVPPSATTAIIGQLLEVGAQCTIQAHAGNGIVFARFWNSDSTQLVKAIVGKLRPAAVNRGGSLVVVRSREALTPHVIWGGRTESTVLLERVKRQFDPRNILNPGRFAY